MWIQLADRFFNTETIAVVRPAGTPEKGKHAQTVIYTTGASAVDAGFLIDIPVNEVMDKIRSARFDEIVDMMDQMDVEEEDDDATREPPEEPERAPEPPESTDRRLNGPRY